MSRLKERENKQLSDMHSATSSDHNGRPLPHNECKMPTAPAVSNVISVYHVMLSFFSETCLSYKTDVLFLTKKVKGCAVSFNAKHNSQLTNLNSTV